MHGDRVRVTTRNLASSWKGTVDDYEVLGDRMQLRVDLEDHGTSRYYYDPETNLFEDCEDPDLKVAVCHRFDVGDRVFVRTEGSPHYAEAVVLERADDSVDLWRRDSSTWARYEFSSRDGWWHETDDGDFDMMILPRRDSEPEGASTDEEEEEEAPWVLQLSLDGKGCATVRVDALGFLRQVSDTSEVNTDPGVWGILLAEVVQHVANAHHQVVSALAEAHEAPATPPADAFQDRIVELLLQELGNPTAELEGHVIARDPKKKEDLH